MIIIIITLQFASEEKNSSLVNDLQYFVSMVCSSIIAPAIFSKHQEKNRFSECHSEVLQRQMQWCSHSDLVNVLEEILQEHRTGGTHL